MGHNLARIRNALLGASRSGDSVGAAARGLALAIPLLAIVPCTRAQQPLFAEGTHPGLTSPTAPHAALTAELVDIDGDRDLDMIAEDSMTGSVLVAEFLGSGRFGPFAAYGTNPLVASRRFDVGIGDLDGDGRIDLVIPDDGQRPYSQARVFLGTVGGTFVEVFGRFPFPMSVPSTPAWSAKVFDADNDGDLDVALGGGCVFANDGTGHFTWIVQFSVCANSAAELQAIDIDNDGDLDLLTNQPEILLNDGTGRFTRGFAFPPEPEATTRCADFDGDGFLDVAVFHPDPIHHHPTDLYLNDGLGGFSHLFGIPGSSVSVRAADVGDIDLDGDVDIVIASAHPTSLGGQPEQFAAYEVWLNDGTGTFTPAPSTAIPTTTNAALSITSLRLSDVDVDGDLDVVTGARTFSHTGPHSNRVLWNLHRHLDAPVAPTLGTTFSVDVWATPGHQAVLLAAFGAAHFDLGDLGIYALDPLQQAAFTAVTVPASRQISYAIPLSQDPALVGLTVHWQAIDFDPTPPATLRLTAARRSTVLP